MKYVWILFAIAALVLAACGPAAEPTMSPADVQGTAMAGAQTMVAETQAAIPTATSIPPTEMPSVTPAPTNTVPPLINLTQSTQVGGATQPAATQAVVQLPTNTAPPSVGSNDPCNQPLTTWDGESAKLIVRNETRPRGHVILALGFTTNMGQCGIISTNVDNTVTLNVPIGTFWASAFVDGKNDFKVFGGDVITRPGGYSLWVENERIILKAGCAPNC
jgi:hypothetical protein